MAQSYNPFRMSRIGNALMAFGLTVALAGFAACTPTQNPYGTGGPNGSHLGSSSSFDSSSSMSRASASGTVAGGTIDSPQSQGLSDYLHHHSLPLVGAQVVTSPSGGRQVILYGFVASDFGKTDAEQKARHYLSDPTLVVDNRIKVSSQLAGTKGSSGSTTPYDSTDPYASSGSIQDYQNNNANNPNALPPGAQAYAAQGQQLQQYQQYGTGGSGSSMLTMILPLLMGGGGGLSMGSGGFGGGGFGYGGGYGGGYAPGYGGYGGYGGYPPPMAPTPGWNAGGTPF
jgi:hypothetical protein